MTERRRGPGGSGNGTINNLNTNSSTANAYRGVEEASHGRTSGPVYFLGSDDQWVLGELAVNDQWVTFEGSESVSHPMSNIVAVGALDFFNYFESFCFELSYLPQPAPMSAHSSRARTVSVSTTRFNPPPPQHMGLTSGSSVGIPQQQASISSLTAPHQHPTGGSYPVVGNGAGAPSSDDYAYGAGEGGLSLSPTTANNATPALGTYLRPMQHNSGAATPVHDQTPNGGFEHPNSNPPPLISVGGGAPGSPISLANGAQINGAQINDPAVSAGIGMGSGPHHAPLGVVPGYGGGAGHNSGGETGTLSLGGVSGNGAPPIYNAAVPSSLQNNGASLSVSAGVLGRVSPVNSMSAVRNGGDGVSVTPMLSPAMSFQDLTAASPTGRAFMNGHGVAVNDPFNSLPLSTPTGPSGGNQLQFSPYHHHNSITAPGGPMQHQVPHIGLNVGSFGVFGGPNYDRLVFKALSFRDFMSWLMALELYLDVPVLSKCGLAVASNTIEPCDDFGGLCRVYPAYGSRLPDPTQATMLLDEAWGQDLLDPKFRGL